jgi:6-pyruvoyltetrahydropterin/6-carboxytetrahydropterin synthase
MESVKRSRMSSDVSSQDSHQFSAWCSQHQMHPNDCWYIHNPSALGIEEQEEAPVYPYPVLLSKEVQFDAGHRVPNHQSKCRNPHGHRYRVVVYATGKIIQEAGAPDEGMLVDFSDLKKFLVERIHNVLDHGFIIFEKDKELLYALEPLGYNLIIFPYVPTAENIARWVYHELFDLVEGHYRGNMKLERIDVWETPTSLASYPWKQF